ncbi:hypothetical protein BHU16_05010 [Tannerella sp. oral taxon 808]|nr:hypothetical protein BHU16_05010 [Tannerella sp. oral taxon 808]
MQAKSPIEALKPYPDKAKSWHLGSFLFFFTHSETPERMLHFISLIRNLPKLCNIQIQLFGKFRKE